MSKSSDRSTAIPRKRFAQHWLQSDKILAQIVKAANISIADRVLEIGPGTGILTRQLLSLAQALVAVEIDSDLCQLLAKELGKKDNFLLLQGDFLELDLKLMLLDLPQFYPQNKVVANIPYNITGEILQKLLGRISQPAAEKWDAIVLLIQKEVADRLTAKPGSKAFGALSVKVQYLAECELVCRVPAKAFYPPPKVDSAVVKLHPRPFPVAASDPKKLENLVKAGFAAKRKMLRNNLQGIVPREDLNNLLEQLGVNPQARAEDLGVAEWVALANKLYN